MVTGISKDLSAFIFRVKRSVVNNSPEDLNVHLNISSVVHNHTLNYLRVLLLCSLHAPSLMNGGACPLSVATCLFRRVYLHTYTEFVYVQVHCN